MAHFARKNRLDYCLFPPGKGIAAVQREAIADGQDIGVVIGILFTSG
ncbi:MAG: hypothetical protein P4K94_04420 [Terracidiphilus sp.]|nr:hypothetical protein [Terracidiphilus sp.]